MARVGAQAGSDRRHALRAHPSGPIRDGLIVQGSIALAADRLVLDLVVEGELSALAVPGIVAQPRRRDRLWERTCFEAFLGASEDDGYVEVNLSPSGDWAVWRLDSYRAGLRPAESIGSPRIDVTLEAERLHIGASLRAADVLSSIGGPPYPASLAAVLEDTRGGLSYWACEHPSAQPDFHDRRGWPLVVYPPHDT